MALAALFLLPRPVCASDAMAALKAAAVSGEFVDLATIEGVAVDLKYASTSNVLGENIYGGFKTALMRREGARMLAQAASRLRADRPGYSLLIFDALRPRSIQRLFWSKVKGTPFQKYVADPEKGSIHNFGMALDITAVDETGHELDMGTAYDDFTQLAQPRTEKDNLARGLLSAQQAANRLILRSAMESAGFIQNPIEWWHYDAMPKDKVRAIYKIVE